MCGFRFPSIVKLTDLRQIWQIDGAQSSDKVSGCGSSMTAIDAVVRFDSGLVS